MTTALAQIQEEIAKLEERLKLLRAAEAALQALEIKVEKGLPMPWPPDNPPAKGLAAAIRELLAITGPMTKLDIERRLASDFRLGKGSISGALQAMKVRGVVARTKGGKWTVK